MFLKREFTECKDLLDETQLNSKKEIKDLKDQYEFDLSEYQLKVDINLKSVNEEFTKKLGDQVIEFH